MKTLVLLISGFLSCAYAQTEGSHGALSARAEPLPSKPGPAKPSLDVRDYDFAAQTPGISLTPRQFVTITMSPCPAGVAGSNHNHYLYISGGDGAPEPVLLSGGTCLGGAASGTLTFTPANHHTGAWTIGSASSGIKEALNVCSASRIGSVLVPAGSWNIFAVLDISNNCPLRGSGQVTTALQCRMLSRCVQWIGSSDNSYHLSLNDLQINYPSPGTSQEGLYIEDVAIGEVDNLVISNPFDGMTLYSAAHLFLHHIYGFVNRNGINLSSNPRSRLTAASYPQVHDINLILQHSGAGLNLKATLAGPQFTNMVIYGGDYCIAAEESSGNPINEVNFQGTCDEYADSGIHLNLSGGSTAYRWIIHDSLFSAPGFSDSGIVLATSEDQAGVYQDFTIANNTIGYGLSSGITLQSTKGATISGNTLYVNNPSADVGTAIEISGKNGSSGITISGNNIGGGGPAIGTSKIGILIDGSEHSGIHISSNMFYPTGGEPVVDHHTGSGLVEWRDNIGIDDVIPSVESASTITRPVNPAWKITGSTTVTRIQGDLWPGLKITIFNETESPITIGGGGNIPRSHALGSNSTLSLIYDGSNWY